MKPKNIIISIKPKYALKIMEGKKTIELRRRFPTEDIKGGIAIIYASSPIQKVIGYAIISDVRKLSTSLIWSEYNEQACITQKNFSTYFSGLEEGYAIELSRPKSIEPLDIKQLEEEYNITAPQSYRYAPAEILEIVYA